MSQKRGPKRCYLPVVRINLEDIDKVNKTKAISVLDSGSEMSIITPNVCEKLKLKGKPVLVVIIGAGGIATTLQTKLVQLYVIDKSGTSTLLECVVLQKACGKALPIDAKVLKECGTTQEVDITKFVAKGGKLIFW